MQLFRIGITRPHSYRYSGAMLILGLLLTLSGGTLEGQQSQQSPGPPLLPPQNPYSDPDQSHSDLQLVVPGALWEMSVSPLGGLPTRLAAGQLTDDALIDLWLHDGSVADTVYAIDIFGNTLHQGAVLSDIVTYDHPGSPGTRQVSASAAGLAWSLEAPGQLPQSFALGSALWSNATSLQVGDINRSGSLDLVGIALDGSVLVMHDLDSLPLTESSFAPSSPALQLMLVNWDNTAGDEIVVRTATDLCIYKSDGIFVTSVPIYGNSGALTQMNAYGMDWVVWVGPGPALGNEYLVVFHSASPLYVFPVGLRGCNAIAAGDLTGDALPEVAIRYGADGDLLLLVNGGGGFDAANPTLAQEFEGYAGDGADSTPLFHDLDSDGDLELVWACAGGSKLKIVRSGVVDANAQTPYLADIRYDFDDANIANYFKIVLDNPDPQEFVLPSNFTHIQATLYRKGSVGALTDTTPHASLSLPISFDLPSSPPGTQTGSIASIPLNPRGGGLVVGQLPTRANFLFHGDSPLITPYDPWIVTLPEASVDLDNTTLYALVLRYTEMIDDNGVLNSVASGPAQVLLFTTEEYGYEGMGGPLDYLAAIGDYFNGSFVAADSPPAVGPIQAELQAVGTLVPTKPIPDVESEEKLDLDDKK